MPLLSVRSADDLVVSAIGNARYRQGCRYSVHSGPIKSNARKVRAMRMLTTVFRTSETMHPDAALTYEQPKAWIVGKVDGELDKVEVKRGGERSKCRTGLLPSHCVM